MGLPSDSDGRVVQSSLPPPSAKAQRMDVGLLRTVLTSLAGRGCAPHDPVGC